MSTFLPPDIDSRMTSNGNGNMGQQGSFLQSGLGGQDFMNQFGLNGSQQGQGQGPRIYSGGPQQQVGGNLGNDAFSRQFGMNSPMQSYVQSVTPNQNAYSGQLQQYQNLLGSVNQTQKGVMGDYGQAMKLLQGQGQVQGQMLGMQNQQQLAGAQNDLTSRGLGNSTVVNSVQGGINRNYGMLMNSLAEQVSAQRAGLLTQQAGARMGLGQMRGDAILSGQNLPPTGQMGQMGQMGTSTVGGMPPSGANTHWFG